VTIRAHEFPAFRARAPWWGADLQTLRNTLLVGAAKIAVASEERIIVALSDGSGDRLLATLNRPRASNGAEKPLAILIHGMSGCQDSPHVVATAAYFVAQGYPVLRVNLRGAGISRPLCKFHYHAGRTEDLADLFARLPRVLAAAGTVAIGYSLGGNLLLKYLGEQGGAAPVKGAVAISTPLDLAGCALRLMQPRNALYQRYLLRALRAEALGSGAELNARERAAVLGARSIWEFDEDFTAPRNGFAGTADYYARSASGQYLDAIKVPTLVIYARNDPWIPPEPYLARDWRSNPMLVPLLAATGGHVGFHGRDRRAPWHDLCAAQFLAAL